MDHLDKWTVMDEILPFLQQIKSREPSILMGILGKFLHWATFEVVRIHHHVSIYSLLFNYRRIPECIQTPISVFP